MSGEAQFKVFSFAECWWGLSKNISVLFQLHLFKTCWGGGAIILEMLIEIYGLMCPLFTPLRPINFFIFQVKHLPLWCFLALSCSLAPGIWIEASLISCSENPAVSFPLCKLLVNEWAGHLTPWGSTAGSSDHQLLSLELTHAPVNMMNPDHKWNLTICFFLYCPSLKY